MGEGRRGFPTINTYITYNNSLYRNDLLVTPN